MIKRGEYTSNDARPDEKMGSEARTRKFGGMREITSSVNKQFKRSMAKKRRQRDTKSSDGYKT